MDEWINKMWYIHNNGILFSLKQEGNYGTFYNIDAGFPGGSLVKNPPANAGDPGDTGSIPGSGRSPGGGNGHPLQYSCLENSMDRGAWRATVHTGHGVAKSRTQLSTYTHMQHTHNLRTLC